MGTERGAGRKPGNPRERRFEHLPNLLYRLGGEQVAAVLAPLLPTALAPLLTIGMGLLLAGLFGYLSRSAWVASVGLGLLAMLMASQLPAVAGPGLLLAVDGPLLMGAFCVRGPARPTSRSTRAAPSH